MHCTAEPYYSSDLLIMVWKLSTELELWKIEKNIETAGNLILFLRRIFTIPLLVTTAKLSG